MMVTEPVVVKFASTTKVQLAGPPRPVMFALPSVPHVLALMTVPAEFSSIWSAMLGLPVNVPVTVIESPVDPDAGVSVTVDASAAGANASQTMAVLTSTIAQPTIHLLATSLVMRPESAGSRSLVGPMDRCDAQSFRGSRQHAVAHGSRRQPNVSSHRIGSRLSGRALSNTSAFRLSVQAVFVLN
jgi:hypothetical protein